MRNYITQLLRSRFNMNTVIKDLVTTFVDLDKDMTPSLGVLRPLKDGVGYIIPALILVEVCLGISTALMYLLSYIPYLGLLFTGGMYIGLFWIAVVNSGDSSECRVLYGYLTLHCNDIPNTFSEWGRPFRVTPWLQTHY